MQQGSLSDWAKKADGPVVDIDPSAFRDEGK